MKCATVSIAHTYTKWPCEFESQFKATLSVAEEHKTAHCVSEADETCPLGRDGWKTHRMTRERRIFHAPVKVKLSP
jgi:hypothetical protein